MKIIFAGTPENAAMGLELVAQHHEVALVITRPDAEIGRKRVLTPSPVAQKAVELDLPLL
jgi:methionyl-tRNA formyltransferase